MITLRIQHNGTKTDFLTTDFMDVWSEIEKIPDGEVISITKKEMTVPECEQTLKERAALNMSIKTPWKDGPE